MRTGRLPGSWPVWPTVTSVAASGTAAATTLVIARGIGAEAFGHFTVVLSIALVVTVAMQLSLHYVMYQELPRAQPAERPALMTTALLSTLVLGFAVTTAGLLASPLLTAALGVDLRTLCFGLALALAMALNLLAESFLRGLKRFAFVAGLKLAVAAGYLGASAGCLLLLGIRDAEFYLAGLIATYLAFAVLAAGAALAPPAVPATPRPAPPAIPAPPAVPASSPAAGRRGGWSASLARSLYRHGAWVTVIAALTGVLFGLDVIFLNHWSDRADVGVYSVYNGFPKRLLGVVFTEGIGLVLLPLLATMDKPALLRRIGRLAPAVGLGAAALSFAASVVFLFLLRAEYPYSPGLMALAAAGIGAHTVFNLYFFALSMDGLRGAKVFVACLAAGLAPALACQAAFIAWWGVAGGLVAFTLSNLLLVAVVVIATGRVYRLAGPVAGGARIPEARA